MQLPFGPWVTRIVLPVAAVFLALGLMTAAAVASATGAWDPATRWDVFTLGVGAWFAGVTWGVWVNGRPLPVRAVVPTSDAD